MSAREASELGCREAKAHPILIFGLYGICAGVALNLPPGAPAIPNCRRYAKRIGHRSRAPLFRLQIRPALSA